MIPASQRRCRTAKESRGVERGSSNRKTLKPAAASTRAQSSANSAEWCRVSWAITHDRRESAALSRGHIVGQAAGALGDRPLVEDVGADRVHLAAPAAGAELEHRVEGVVELLPALLLDVLEQPVAIPGERGSRSASGGCSPTPTRKSDPSDSAFSSRASASSGVIMVRRFLSGLLRSSSMRSQANPIAQDPTRRRRALAGETSTERDRASSRASRGCRSTQPMTLMKVSLILLALRALVKTSLL